MYELLYLGRVMQIAEKYPRESIAAAAAVLISGQITKVKIEKTKLEAAMITRECELIRLKTAQIEAENNASS